MNMNTSEVNNLEAEIISTIKGIPATIPKARGDTIWTRAIKSALKDLGKSKGYGVCTAGFTNEECDNEWLYDMVWYRNNPPDFLGEIGMIFESEWNQDPSVIKYDFEKLLVGKSPVKVMVFQDFKDNLPNLWSMLEAGIHCFKTERTNEKYILVAFRNSEWEEDRLPNVFDFKTITA
jgi:hypothetical protein